MMRKLNERINIVLLTLPYREREMLKLRYGIDHVAEYTFKEIGDLFNVSLERSRQIIAKAFRKMQHPVRVRKLQSMFDALDTDDPVELYDAAIDLEDYDQLYGE